MSEPVKVNGATPMPHERPDRVAWRVRLKAHPTTRWWFRIGVGLVGVSMLIAAPLTGWLPGPGGIPLFLAGLAVLSTEFLWAKRFRKWLVRQLRTYLDWPVWRQRIFWACFFACIGAFQWVYLSVMGVPAWVPAWAADLLRFLPGVD